MATLATSVKTARDTLEAIVHRTCGACGNKCCHQGTMMGSQDLRRLEVGLALEEGREQKLRDGLRQRSVELRVDLRALEEVAELLRDSLPAEREAELDLLKERLEEWREFCEFIESDFEITHSDLSYLLRFSAIRHNALRLLREFPEAQTTLLRLASEGGASFRASGRRLAAPRCLFDVDGCLAGSWKPAKCANFFCAGEPNVLREIASQMSFDDFVLANCQPTSVQKVLKAIALEHSLGPKYVAPKLVVGAGQELIDAVSELLDSVCGMVEVKQRGDAHFMLATAEAHTLLKALPADMAYVLIHKSVDSAALYELGVALDRLRVAGAALPFYLFAEEFRQPAVLPHPLWVDEVMSQPLGAVDLQVIE